MLKRYPVGLIRVLLAITVICVLLPVSTMGRGQSAITGQVVDTETGEPIFGASIAVVDSDLGAVSDSTGRFEIGRLNAGEYQLKVSYIGYEGRTTDIFALDSDDSIDIIVKLKKKPVSIKGIIVTPGQFSIQGDEPTTRQVLPREIIETRPQLAEDLFRAVQRLPGIAYKDFSAKFNIRGGEQDEVLINIDGMEIYEPFHMKDVDGGVISITDVAAIQGVDLMTGGYPANYGDRMSGVFNIKSKNPTPNQNRMSVGLSLMNARLLSEGTFADNRGSWLLSARRGYLDLLLDVSGQEDEIRPQYYDVFGKLRYRLTDKHYLSASLLRAYDKMEYKGALTDTENNLGDTLLSSYGNTYFWLTMDSYLNSKVVGRTIASIGDVSTNREGKLFNEARGVPESAVDDQRDLDIYGLKTEWELELHNDFLLKAGVDYKHVTSDYDYQEYIYTYELYPGGDPPYGLVGVDSGIVAIDPSGDKFSGYVSNRVRFTKFLTGEFGVRYDNTSYAGDDNWSPRANLAVSFSPTTSLKLGWGHYYQIQRMDEINVQDDETNFYPAEKAEHYVAGLEHKIKTGEIFRLNFYYKDYSDLRPAYRNTFGELLTFPELEEDRVRVDLQGKTSKGFELGISKDIGERISYWLSYSLSEVKDDVQRLYYYNEDIIVNYDKEFPFPYDQLHTLYLDVNYRFNDKWLFNLAWQYHTGWPYTDVIIRSSWINGQQVSFLEADEPWRGRHEHFKRLDLRLNRKFSVGSGTITAFIEVINALGKANIRNYEYSLLNTNGTLSVEKVNEKWFGVMPSFGINYVFDM